MFVIQKVQAVQSTTNLPSYKKSLRILGDFLISLNSFFGDIHKIVIIFMAFYAVVIYNIYS